MKIKELISSNNSDDSNPFGESESIKKQKINKLLIMSESSKSSKNSSIRKKKSLRLNFVKLNSSNQKLIHSKKMNQSYRNKIIEADGEDETDNDCGINQVKLISQGIKNT
jgi:hypothetical protein